MVIKFQTDAGLVRVESSGESFFMVTLRYESDFPYEMYVSAYDAKEAAQKAFKHLYRTTTQKLTLI